MPFWVFLILGFLVLLSGIGITFMPVIDAWRCQQIIRRHSATFYQAFSTIRDARRREGIFAVYAFCRHVDDIIDEQHDLDQLINVERQLSDFVHQGVATNFRFRALKKMANQFYPKSYDYQPYFDMIRGQRFDAKPVLIKTYAELEQYCDWVASSVGMMLLPILAPGQERALSTFALALGRAFQLTNILRDVGEDYRRERLYLPSELITSFDVNLSEVMGGKKCDSFIQLWEYLAKKAETYYDQALQQIKQFPRDTQFPLAAALFFYQEILQVCRQSGYQVIHQKNYVHQEQKKVLLKRIQTFLSI